MIMYSIFLIMPNCFTLFVRSLDLYFVITFDELFHYILLIYDNQMIKFRLTIKFIGVFFCFFFFIKFGWFLLYMLLCLSLPRAGIKNVYYAIIRYRDYTCILDLLNFAQIFLKKDIFHLTIGSGLFSSINRTPIICAL